MEKYSQEEGEPGRNSDVEKVRREKIRDIRNGESQKGEDSGALKGRKVANHSVFPMFCGSGGSTSRLAKAAGADTSGQMRNNKLHTVVARSRVESKKCMQLWREAPFEAKSVKRPQLRTTFGS